MKLPYITLVGGGFHENCIVRLLGKMFEQPASFTVRLAYGEHERDDAPFILTSLPLQNKITVKRQNSKNWTTATTETGTQYFGQATNFDFTITCTPKGFTVNLDGVEHTYPHELPYYCIRYIVIDGHIHLNDVRMTGFPAEEERIRIPVQRDLPEVIKGKRMKVHGVPVCAKPYKMMIDFQVNKNTIAFHFNPRFNDQVLVRNNLVDGTWRNEERELVTPFPFIYGVAFELEFDIIEADHFDVKLNGYPLCSFRRQTPGVIKEMKIFGSVVITKAELE